MIKAKKNFSEIDKSFQEMRSITPLEEDLVRIDTVKEAAQGYQLAMD